MRAKLLALAGIASAFLWASTANSATVSIGAVPGNQAVAPVQVAINAAGATRFACLPCNPAIWGVFIVNQITAIGRPINPLPNILGSTFQINALEGGTLRVFVTSQNNTEVNSNWISSFTSNSLPPGWSVREQTFIDTANGQFTIAGNTVTQLGNVLFFNEAIGTNVAAALAASGNNYSVTHLYTLVATGAGSTFLTINLQTPLPGALPLFATGLLGLWALRRKRKAAPAKSLDPVVV